MLSPYKRITQARKADQLQQITLKAELSAAVSSTSMPLPGDPLPPLDPETQKYLDSLEKKKEKREEAKKLKKSPEELHTLQYEVGRIVSQSWEEGAEKKKRRASTFAESEEKRKLRKRKYYTTPILQALHKSREK